MLENETEYFECDCHDNEHLLRFSIWYDEDVPECEIYAHFFLNTHGFFKRIWIALKYVFGYKCRYGHWNEWIISRDDTEKLRNFCDKMIEFKKKYVQTLRPSKKTQASDLSSDSTGS